MPGVRGDVRTPANNASCDMIAALTIGSYQAIACGVFLLAGTVAIVTEGALENANALSPGRRRLRLYTAAASQIRG
jgi:hypothetical protein